MKMYFNDTTTRSAVWVTTAIHAAKKRAADDEGSISGQLVLIAGLAIAAIAVVGILYTIYTNAANDVDLDPNLP